MLRTARTILICFALGVLLTTLFAWLCAWVRPLVSDDDAGLIFVDEHDTKWLGVVERGIGWSRMWLFAADGLSAYGAGLAEPNTTHVQVPDERSVMRIVHSGWPFTCFVGRQFGVDDTEADIARTGQAFTGLGPQAVRWDTWQGAAVLSDDDPLAPRGGAFIERIIPYAPVWPMLAANSVIFAVGIWVVLFAPRALRRQLRERHGRCPRCGYDLRGSPGTTCPECGTSPARTRMPE